ncbi:hypothetical protein [Fangia hongkongensis]|uniref:hypothetical protein n=3 Tax=Fangia hongkongensis TaxID=270495 RepID=UPI000377877D|nr:hypothetical protein [Fangia hongkongensis]
MSLITQNTAVRINNRSHQSLFFSYERILIILLIVTTTLAQSSFASQAADYNNSVPKDEALMAQKINQAAILSAHPTDTFGDQYNPNPSETRYYSDDDSAMNAAAQSALASSDIVKTAHIVKNKQPSTGALENSSFVKTNKLFFTDAYNVAHGTSDDQIDCENGHTCHFVFEPKSCEKTIPATIHCNKTAIPHTRIIKVPAQYIPFGGTGKTDWRSEPYHSGAHFTFPTTGVLRSFPITSHGNWYGHFWIHIPPIISTIDTRLMKTSVSYLYQNLHIQVTQGEQGQLSADGREYASVPDMTIAYNGVIEIPAYERKESYITWSDTICP